MANGTGRQRSFARWYRARPFIGGVLVVLGGVEMFFSGQLTVGDMRVQVGIEGFQATLIPVVLVLVGVLAVLMPQHRIFYGVIGLVVAVYSLVGVNLGGFFVGMLLACVGGVMIVSWMPRPEGGTGRRAAARRSHRRAAGGALAVAITITTAVGLAAGAPQRAAAAEATGVCLFGVIGDCTTPAPAPSGGASSSGGPTPSGAPTAPAAVGGAGGASGGDASPATPAGPRLVAPASTSPVFTGTPALLQGSSLSFSGLRYLGLATVRLSNGGTATVLKLSMNSVTIPGFRLDTRDANGAGTDTVATQMAFSGGVDTYCATLKAITQNGDAVTYDVTHPPSTNGSVPAARIISLEVFGITGGSSVLTGFHEAIS